MKILLTEAEPSRLMAMREYVASEQYIVSIANSFREAFQKIHKYTYGRIVIDSILRDGNRLAIRRPIVQADYWRTALLKL